MLCLTAGCQGAKDAHYRFEAQPPIVIHDADLRPAKSPQVGVSPSRGLFVLGAYGDGANQQLALLASHDMGDTFEPPVAVTEPNASIRASGEAGPSLAVTSTAIYALWEQDGPSGGSDLLFAREQSPGKPFQKPVQITDKTQPSFTGFSSMAVAPNGNVYIVWLDGRSPSEMHGTFSVYLARSTDRGMSFGPNVLVASGACPCCRPRVTVGEDGSVYVFWRKVFQGQVRDMVASVSHDSGVTFGASVRVSEDNWKINGCPESGPAAASVGGRVFVAWMTETDQGHAGVRLSWTDDGGKSFAPAVEASAGLLDANHPALTAVDGSRAVLAFQARDHQKNGGWSETQPYLVEIQKSGAVSKPIPISSGVDSASYVAVANGGAGRIFVAWTAAGREGTTIELTRGRRDN